MFEFLKRFFTFQWWTTKKEEDWFVGTCLEGRLVVYIPQVGKEHLEELATIWNVPFKGKTGRMIMETIWDIENRYEAVNRRVSRVAYQDTTLACSTDEEELAAVLYWLAKEGHWMDPLLCN